MPESFDLQQRLDDLVSDVSRAAGPGDARVPQRRARRRSLAGAVAAVVVATAGITTVQVLGDDARDSAPDIADRGGQVSPGQERRERLLGLLPADTGQAGVLDVEGFTGAPGLALDDPADQRLTGYLLSSFVTLRFGPFERLLLPDLVTYAGSGATDVFLVDRAPAEVRRDLARAGWVPDGGALVPGERVSRLDGRVAPYVLVAEEDGQALVVLARERSDLPDLRRPTPEPGPAAGPLVDLGGALGVSLGVASSCTLQAFSISSESAGSVLLGPPEGTPAEEVRVEDLQVPSGFSSIDAVSPSGDDVVARVTVAGPDAPFALLERLGLPGTEFC